MNSAGRHILLIMIAALACATAEAGQAATASAQSRATIPDWNGAWAIAGGFIDTQDGTSVATFGRFDPAAAAGLRANQPAYKGEYLKEYQAMQKAAAGGKTVDDVSAMCLPPGMPAFWAGPYAFEILQTPQQINLYQEAFEQSRRIYLNERKQPADLTPSYQGHSIGHWEGGALVIDTVGIRADTLLFSGGGAGPHSDVMHISERLQSEGPDRLKVVMTVDDPKAFSKPWVDVIHLHRKPGMEIMEYVCEDNNRNPASSNGPDGFIFNK